MIPATGNETIQPVRIVARNTLVAYWTRHPETRAALEHWLTVASAATWSSSIEVMGSFSKAKVLNSERVRFEVAGGDYRLVVSFHYRLQIAWIKFIGTHAEYDRIDALTISQF
ncbi:MAG: type II toxin-antitoxin system HigB family toxin [Nevskiaceae bacterium]|nr:type II toxin-antitoxin system HigB family toxin [Nevskiaceae bacterium]